MHGCSMDKAWMIVLKTENEFSINWIGVYLWLVKEFSNSKFNYLIPEIILAF